MKKLKKDVSDFTKAGVTLGIGSAVVGATGHGGQITPAFGTAGRMMGVVGTSMMGMNALRMLSKPRKKKKK